MGTWISIGSISDLDPTEGNLTSEDASDLIGTFDNTAMSFVNVSANDANGDGKIWEDDLGGGETVTVNGVESGLDSIQEYYATVTLGDGTTFNTTLGVAQLVNGEAYIVPTSEAQLDGLSIQSIEFTSVHTDDYDGMYATSAARSVDNSNLVCFASGTQITTDKMSCAVETLERGQNVLTMDNGLQPIRWIGHTCSRVPENARPIRIERNALGDGLPKEALTVSPQHRVLLSSKIVSRMFGHSELLIPAKKLVGMPGINVAAHVNTVSYWHIMLDRHEIIFANEAPAESLYAGPVALQAVGNQAREQIFSIFPCLRDQTHRPEPAREIARGKAVRKLLERHVKNRLPLTSLD